MFNKTDTTAAPSRPVTGTPSGKTSVLSSDLKITGDITSAGAIEVMGEVDGTITAHSLTVGTDGRVTGTISADAVEVKGKLDGKISCNAFTLRSAAKVKADVNYASLVIENGAEIEGRFTHAKI